MCGNGEQSSALDRIVRHGSLQGVVPVTYPSPLPDDVVAAYLARLGLGRPREPSRQALEALLAAHVEGVAYENVDLKLGRPLLPLDPLASAKRIALEQRGGYCFNLVDAFAALLSSLGFTVSLHAGTCAADPPPEESWGNHVVAIVHLPDGPYIADVGLGEGPRLPFRLETRSWVEDGFSFSLEERPNEGGWRFNNPANVTGSMAGFSVDTSTSVRGVGVEFEAYHRWYWTNPESNYKQGPVFMHRITEQGVLSLFGCVLRRSHPELQGYEILCTATSREEWFAMVRDNFFMPLEDLSTAERDRLWAAVSAEHAARVAAAVAADEQG